jgi:putative tryptophan/tyrosine transport system substrate-binding protein
MWRSTLRLLVAFGILVAPLPPTAQPQGKVVRIGWLYFGVVSGDMLDGLRQGLREFGYVEGQNLTIEQRNAAGYYERLPDLATDLVKLPVDVLVAAGAATTRAAQRATSTIPIIIMTSADPVQEGLVASLAQPGGNITGVSSLQVALLGKRLELLKETIPTLSRIATLWNPANPTPFMQETQVAAQALGVQLLALGVSTPTEFEGAFAAASGQAEALLVMPDSFLHNHRTRIVDFAQRHRLPGMYPDPGYARDGGLMSYATSVLAMGHRAGMLAGKILQGAKPAELPVEQATKFEFIINLKTAKALGIMLPPHLLMLADEVIQ